MRGKVSIIFPFSYFRRITPAHAGKRLCLSAHNPYYQDHPRPCGEKPNLRSHMTGQTGSPPPMRGKVTCLYVGSSCAGITPAHAGKSPPARTRTRTPTDHPRPCGEKPSPLLFARREPGSPPPMRGKDNYFSVGQIITGITPAHAGKRRIYATWISRNGDHPRPCGEKQSFRFAITPQ